MHTKKYCCMINILILAWLENSFRCNERWADLQVPLSPSKTKQSDMQVILRGCVYTYSHYKIMTVKDERWLSNKLHLLISISNKIYFSLYMLHTFSVGCCVYLISILSPTVWIYWLHKYIPSTALANWFLISYYFFLANYMAFQNLFRFHHRHSVTFVPISHTWVTCRPLLTAALGTSYCYNHLITPLPYACAMVATPCYVWYVYTSMHELLRFPSLLKGSPSYMHLKFITALSWISKWFDNMTIQTLFNTVLLHLFSATYPPFWQLYKSKLLTYTHVPDMTKLMN